MLIDWFTVAAQALNFIILVWLMKRVLYKPIMAAIDARERLVAAELAAAAAKTTDAGRLVEEFNSKNENFDRDRAVLFAKATQEAKIQSARLLEAARAAADALQVKRRNALQSEVTAFCEDLGRRAQEGFFTLARRAFKDLANCGLEEQIVALFCERLRAMKKENKDKLSVAIQTSNEPASIRSAFALAPNLQNSIQTAIDEAFQRPIAVRFGVAPDLIGGIELTAGGQQVSWSIAEYVAALERSITTALPIAPSVKTPVSPAREATSSPAAALLAVT